jgi:tetratricopeptide (TPR) repeat protein
MQQIFSDNTPEENFRRRIDDHYHLEMIADNSRQIIEYQTEAFHMQREAAIANLRGLAEVANRQNQTNNLLSIIVQSVSDLNNSLDVQTQVLQQGFVEVARILLQHQQTLEQIADVLRRPYETKVLELLQEADRALKTGMKSTGRDQQAEFADTTRLLKEVLANPIGSRNYVAWFQTGWLKWKYERNIAQAEEAFYQASRLSAPQADLYHANALRHMAYMQYGQKKYPDAYTSIYQALKLSPDDHDIRYDAARYAAKVGRESEALDLLEKCIEQQPQTIFMMFSEEDFLQ